MISDTELYDIQHNNEFMMRVIGEDLEKSSRDQVKQQLLKDESTINILIGEIHELRAKQDDTN